MIVHMGHKIFRGQHGRRATDVSYLYRVFIDAGRHETTWRASFYRDGDKHRCGELHGALPEGFSDPCEGRAIAIAQVVEAAIDAGDVEGDG